MSHAHYGFFISGIICVVLCFIALQTDAEGTTKSIELQSWTKEEDSDCRADVCYCCR